MLLEEGRIQIAEHACDVAKGEVPEVVPRNMAVLNQFPSLGKDLSLIGDIPVTDVRTEERVEADAKGKAGRV